MAQITEPSRYIDTTQWPNPTVGCVQRHIDRCQDGTLVVAMLKTPPGESIIDNYVKGIPSSSDRFDSSWWFRGMYFSKDNGVTWTQMAVPLNEPTGVVKDFYGAPAHWAGPIRALGLFVDIDDNIHFIFDGFIHVGYYMVGRPNAGRTAWTWSNALAITSYQYQPSDGRGSGVLTADGLGAPTSGVTGASQPGVVAHRDVSGRGGWYAHTVSGLESFEEKTLQHNCFWIPPGSGDPQWTQHNYYPIQLSDVGRFPVIEMRHTGDGKSVTWPDIYIGWSNGLNYGYSLWCAVQTHYVSLGQSFWNAPYITLVDGWHGNSQNGWAIPIIFYDGYYLVYAGLAIRSDPNRPIYDLIAHEVNPYNRSINWRYLAWDINDSVFGTATYDRNKNIYFLGQDMGHRDRPTKYPMLNLRTWNRSRNELGFENFETQLLGPNSTYTDWSFGAASAAWAGGVHLIRHAQNPNQIDFLYGRVREPGLNPPPSPYNASMPYSFLDLQYGRVDLLGEESVVVG